MDDDADVNAYAYEEMHDMGIGPGSADAWSGYAMISPSFRRMVEPLFTPSAFKALHYNPATFKRIYELPGMAFHMLEIFKFENGIFIPPSSRAPYHIVFNAARQMVRMNHRNILRNIIERRTDDISPFVNMGFVFESRFGWWGEEADRQMLYKGFFPYFSNSSVSLAEIMFFFIHAETDRLVLVTAPTSERRRATDFIRAHGAMHFFDKVCAQCGLTGSDMYKCPCKAVRYCSTECQHAHWPLHSEMCELRE